VNWLFPTGKNWGFIVDCSPPVNSEELCLEEGINGALVAENLKLFSLGTTLDAGGCRAAKFLGITGRMAVFLIGLIGI
jgi:hypothetical protein